MRGRWLPRRYMRVIHWSCCCQVDVDNQVLADTRWWPLAFHVNLVVFYERDNDGAFGASSSFPMATLLCDFRQQMPTWFQKHQLTTDLVLRCLRASDFSHSLSFRFLLVEPPGILLSLVKKECCPTPTSEPAWRTCSPMRWWGCFRLPSCKASDLRAFAFLKHLNWFMKRAMVERVGVDRGSVTSLD